MKRISALFICAAALNIGNTAAAADLDVDERIEAAASDRDWALKSLTVGGALTVKPKYEGSDEYEASGLPYIFPILGSGSSFSEFFSRIDMRGLDDVRIAVLQHEGLLAGPVVGYSLGRDEDNGNLLQGLGDIDGGAVAGGYLGYRWDSFQIDMAYRHFFDDSEGYLIDFSAHMKRPISERTA